MLGKTVALIGIAVGLAGLALDFYAIIPAVTTASPGHPARSPIDAFVYFWLFFTHLANLGLVLVYLAEVTRWPWLGWFRRPVTHALMAGQIVLVMVYFHFMLAPLYHFTGALAAANVLLHYVAPITYLVWWAAFSPHGALRFRDVPLMLVPGLIYVAVVLIRGAIAREYPYTLLDPARGGYGQVAIGTSVLVGAVAVFCVLLVGADRLLARRSGRSSGV